MSGKYQMDLLERITFNRYGGTADELRCANILKEEVSVLAEKPKSRILRLRHLT